MWGKLLGGRCMTDPSGKLNPLTLSHVNFMVVDWERQGINWSTIIVELSETTMELNRLRPFHILCYECSERDNDT